MPGSDRWKVRFAPSEVGPYSYMVTLKDKSLCTTPGTLGSGSFTSVASNPGFIKGLNAFIANLPPGAVPDSATLFSNYTDASQASTSDPALQVIGRKNTAFAMFRVPNTTGSWAATLRDATTPTSISGTITLYGMGASRTYSIRWYDPVTGSLLASASSTADTSGTVTFSLPQPLYEDLAAIVS